MGPLFVLVSPCFRENVVVTSKIVSSCVVLIDNFPLKNVILFLSENHISKDVHLFLKNFYFGPTF